MIESTPRQHLLQFAHVLQEVMFKHLEPELGALSEKARLLVAAMSALPWQRSQLSRLSTVKRPEQHETDKAAGAIFRGVFFKWAVTASEEDYGWDFVVEFFRNHQSTGVMFAGQLKGSLHTNYSADGTFISQKLELDSADYWRGTSNCPLSCFTLT